MGVTAIGIISFELYKSLIPGKRYLKKLVLTMICSIRGSEENIEILDYQAQDRLYLETLGSRNRHLIHCFLDSDDVI